MMKSLVRGALCALLAGIIVCTAFLIPVTTSRASAAEQENETYETTPIEDDLKDIDILEYPKNPAGRVQIISFMEYCYSNRPFLAEAYGLFFYVYNPTEQELRTDEGANVVEMATEYGADGEPSDYDNLPLIVLDYTDNHRFYKFKLEDGLEVLQREKEYAAAHDDTRRYDISSIQLWAEGERTAEDYPVALTYRWTGYAKGCGEYSNAESTLDCQAEDLLTLDIPLYHTNAAGEKVSNQTYYRTDRSSLGANHRWQIDTVYFSVDKEIGDEYGLLQKIKAKWYEYQTQFIYVTSDEELKSALTPSIGVDISGYSNEDIHEKIGFGFGDFVTSVTGYDSATMYWNWGYALIRGRAQSNPFVGNTWYNNVDERVNQIDWLFQVENAGQNTVTENELWDYAEDYSKKFGVSTTDEYLRLLGLSDALFTDGTAIHGDGKEVQRGENILEFDTDATFDLRSYDSTLSGWDRFHNWWYGIENGSSWEINDLRPIEEIMADRISSLSGAAEIANDLKINEKDAEEFRTWADGEMENGKQVYLFRFAVTDYIEEVLDVQSTSDNYGVPDNYSHPLSRAQEAVFFGFEMLTLTYNNHGKLTVIPVVQSPIHVFDNIDVYLQEPPGLTWWQILFAVIAILLIILLLLKFCPWLVRGIIWVIMLPFKAIAAVVKDISNASKKRRRKKEEKELQQLQQEQPEQADKA